MNNFKREMNKFIGEDARFNIPLKQKILMKIKEESQPTSKRYGTFRYAAIFTILLAVATSFLFLTLQENGQETQAPATAQPEGTVRIFSGESEHWRARYVFKDLGDGVQERSGTIEYVGGEPKPKEVSFQFIYGNDQESFGGSLLLNEDGRYAAIEPTTCTTCILYDEEDEIPGVFEWGGQKESLVLTTRKEAAWEMSPLFESNNFSMIGEEGRAGFIYGDDEATRFYENKVQKYMWHFWGSEEELAGTFKVIGTHEKSGEEIVVVPEAEQPFLSSNNGADHHIPTQMSLPYKGMWRLEAIFNDKVFGTVFVEVEEPVLTDPETVADIPIFTEYDKPLEVFRFKSDAMDGGNHEYAAHPLLIDPAAYNEKDIARGDVVLYEYAFSNGIRKTVSRVVGLPGENIAIQDGRIFIDGQKLDTFYGKAHRVGTSSAEEYQKWFEENTSPGSSTTGMEDVFQMDLGAFQLGEDEVFLIGDDWFRGSQHKLDVAEIQGEVIGYYKE
ncbi:S26 family signal peptidase [Planococcus sp. FY231025]|uniref:S26 family signal peptidase n=1 Tax=Planococcus sp. FY231025 TaxID=3455699 RepID=UPI003F902EAF